MLVKAVILGLAVGWLRRGSLEGLLNLKLKAIYLVVLAVLLQYGMNILFPRLEPLLPLAGAVHIFSFLLVFIFLYLNYRYLPGYFLIFTGIALNFLVIALNGGAMPVSPEVIPPAEAAFLAEKGWVTHTLAGEDTRLSFLGDNHRLPVPWGSTASIGDFFLSLGIIYAVQKAMLSGKKKPV